MISSYCLSVSAFLLLLLCEIYIQPYYMIHFEIIFLESEHFSYTIRTFLYYLLGILSFKVHFFKFMIFAKYFCVFSQATREGGR